MYRAARATVEKAGYFSSRVPGLMPAGQLLLAAAAKLLTQARQQRPDLVLLRPRWPVGQSRLALLLRIHAVAFLR